MNLLVGPCITNLIYAISTQLEHDEPITFQSSTECYYATSVVGDPIASLTLPRPSPSTPTVIDGFIY